VVLDAGVDVVSDAAMHRTCAVMARRWCPYLADDAHDLEFVEVGYEDIHADGECLATIGDYGDGRRAWTVPHP
jgi:hypothetical protein